MKYFYKSDQDRTQHIYDCLLEISSCVQYGMTFLFVLPSPTQDYIILYCSIYSLYIHLYKICNQSHRAIKFCKIISYMLHFLAELETIRIFKQKFSFYLMHSSAIEYDKKESQNQQYSKILGLAVLPLGIKKKKEMLFRLVKF